MYWHRGSTVGVVPSIVDTRQWEASSVPRSLTVAPCPVQRVVVHISSISDILVGITIKPYDISSTATVEVARAEFIAAYRLPVGRGTSDAPIKADGDGIWWAVTEGLVRGRWKTGVAVGGAGARRVC